MERYLALVFLLNFLVNFLLLYGTNRLAGFPRSPGRALAAGALGGLYGAACMLPEFRFLGAWLWRLTFVGLMSAMAFGLQKSTWRRGIVFFLLSMALGGLAQGIGADTLWTLVLAAATLWLLCLAGFGGGKLGGSYVPVTISHRGKTVQLTALLDTGNSLKDPLSGCPVLVVEAAVGQKLLALTQAQLSDPLGTLACGAYKGLRLIPYHSVGQPAGLLLGLKADSVQMNGKESTCVVAFAPHGIGQGRPFEALAGGTV